MKKFFALVMVVLVSACAWSPEQIDVPYTSRLAPAAVDGAQAVTVSVTASDARTSHFDRVSVKKNGYGMEAAAITSKNDIIETTRSAVQQELAARGFKTGPNGLDVHVDVLTFYSDFKLGLFSGDAVADFVVNLKVSAPDGRVIYSSIYQVQGAQHDILMMSGPNAQAALVDAMGLGVAKIIQDDKLTAALLKVGAPSTAKLPNGTPVTAGS